ncbi:HDOD domain-containing protein [Salinimonas chungwhensis]|uniref:HDOD domain-containing protein n=1 Tax=Salinimonas chungwhensis TaxID=265425 RepID=UPI00036654B1|nr:HDOD domain-containing protein [Salinimonas chungwhensis]
MTFHGLFWSAIIRALLSLRRDLQIQSNADAKAFEKLASVESERIDDDEFDALLNDLSPRELCQQTGRSLAGYFDFNKMGNLVVYMISTKNIQRALQMLKPRSESLLASKITITHSEVPARITMQWDSQGDIIRDEFFCYFFLILFRHIAGRRFDFDSVTLPGNGAGILEPLSCASFTQGEQICLTFSRSWLTEPSFYHSPSIETLLEPALAIRAPSVKQQLLDTFETAPMPARIRAEWVANKLNVSQGALRKMLKAEDIIFSDLLKSFIHGLSSGRLLHGEKTDEVAVALGFSDRRSFERSFKAFSGINAGQLRQLGARLRFSRGNDNLLTIVDNLPPLPATIQAIMSTPEDKLTLKQVVALIQKDPIFHAHVMSKAGKAVYGGSVSTLEQAVGRNLGLTTIKHLAMLFAAQQQLSEQCRHPNIERLTDAMLFSTSVFDALAETRLNTTEREDVRQQLVFGTLSLLLLFHEDCVFADGALRMWQDSDTFADFSAQLSRELGVCVYGASSLMLLRWGFGHDTNHALWQLCKYIEAADGTSVQEEIVQAHNLAFSALASRNGTESLQHFDEPLRSRVIALKEKWG